MANLKVLLWFDVEDYITPESQEALLNLLKMLNQRKVTGIFKIVGEKARRLHEDNRSDILAELVHHEVGYHTDLHSQHPVMTEYLEHYDFSAGAEEFAAKERAGLEDLQRITGMPVKCFGQPGYAWAPQTFAALKHWGVPVYLDDHDQISWEEKPFWYGGLLNFTDLKGTMRMALNADGLEKAKQDFDQLYEELSDEAVGFISIYYHPCEFACRSFWDKHNFGLGLQTPREEWQPSPLRAEGEMEFYLERLGQFLDYTLSKGNVEYLTSEQAYNLEASSQDVLESADIRALAAQVGNELTFQVQQNHSFSAAELFALFRSYLLGKELRPEFLYGPQNGTTSEAAGLLRVADIKQAISGEEATVFGFKQLPDYFIVGGGRINPVDLTCTLAAIIDRQLADDDEIELIRGVLKAQEFAKDNELWGPRWAIFPEDFEAPNVVRMSKLQTWTLKPALFAEEERYA
ncbi:hypothetical protein [Paenibacillus eucommiae]|uniref:Deacetylase n=1 Tax=Paenibacillus eucommiae TaxID=1355755 RepID=A0ABS4J716_9BACL|nr:hypothetical protein [Paenibacillus eucommiae]MBP1995612.1 putative deacetylase [Paenibacillus eucommiae]